MKTTEQKADKALENARRLHHAGHDASARQGLRIAARLYRAAGMEQLAAVVAAGKFWD